MSPGAAIRHRRGMQQTSEQTQIPSPSTSTWSGKRLYRSRNQRMLAGVSGGLAEYFGIDPTIVRLGFVITSFFGGAGIIGYVVAWLIIPEA
jgi:phage shock protein C